MRTKIVQKRKNEFKVFYWRSYDHFTKFKHAHVNDLKEF